MVHISHSNSSISEEFNRKAEDYLESHSHCDTTMGMHEQLRRSIVESLIKGHGNLLEVGCGPGWYIDRFSHDFKCYGVDISIDMLKECRKKQLDVCLATGEFLPFKNDTFDYIICINMFQYVDNPLLFLRELKKIAKSNCVLIIDFKNKASLRSVIHMLYSKFRTSVEPDNEKRYSIFEFLKFLDSSKWKKVKVIGTEFDFFQTSLKPRPIYLMNLFKFLDMCLSSTPFKYFSGRLFLMLK